MTLESLNITGLKSIDGEKLRRMLDDAFKEDVEPSPPPDPPIERKCNCGGKLARRKIHEPFTAHTRIGPGGGLGVLFVYAACETCKAMYEL